MHYGNLVIIEAEGVINEDGGINKEVLEEKVAAAMEPGEGDWWDWYQIGGRWSGVFSDYDPQKDEKNRRPCRLCEGTGVRRDGVGFANGMHAKSINEEGHPRNGETGWCNGCNGTGTEIAWPTEWEFDNSDVFPVTEIPDDYHEKVFRVVLLGRVYSGEVYLPWRKKDPFIQIEKPPAAWLRGEQNDDIITNYYYDGADKYLAVVVDNHN